jgi:hypothetical protein
MLNPNAPAQLFYDASDFEIVRPGSYVLCAVTGARIALEDLKYWSAAYQEAYRGAVEATAAIGAGGAKNLKAD